MTADISFQVVEVNPEMARDWLGAKRPPNRNLNQSYVNRYASMIQRGEWRLTGEPIKFNAAGQLIDGQHRLAAVIAADKPITVAVVAGIDDGAFSAMDRGRKRSVAGDLSQLGYRNAKNLGGAVAALITYERTGAFHRASAADLPSTDAVVAFIEAHPDIVTIVSEYSTVRFLRVSLATMLALRWLFSQRDADDANVFFDRLREGANLAPDDPILLLRNRLLSFGEHHRSTDTHFTAGLVIKAWNAYREGRRLGVLKFRPGGANPEELPVIV